MSDSEKPKEKRDWLAIVIDACGISIAILAVAIVAGLVYYIFKVLGIF